MAPIPKKDKNIVFNKDNISNGVLLALLFFLILYMTFFEVVVNEKLHLVSFLFFASVMFFFLLPSTKNKGKNTIQSYYIMFRYIIRKLKKRWIKDKEVFIDEKERQKKISISYKQFKRKIKA